MKKNFMAIASLLIAAMLLVVSCSQESVVPENNGLVKASLSVGYGRDIKVNGDTVAVRDLTVEYKMTPQWTNTNGEKTGDDQITNPAKDWTALPVSGNLGWITPGHWLIEVRAAKGNGENAKTVFSGSINAYFSNKTRTATVYLSPTTGSSSITIDVSMQDIQDNDASAKYKLKYEILTGKGGSLENKPKTDIPVVPPTEGAVEDYITEYKTSKIDLEPGFYTVIIYVVDAAGNDVGGIRKGLLLADGDNATLTGHIEPADYANVTINAVYVNVNIKLEKGAISKTEAGDYQIVVNAEDLTTVPTYAGNFDVTYEWFVNGVAVPDSQSNTLSGTAENTKTGSMTFTFANPGYKNIACQATYKVTVDSNTEYYFTATDSIYELVLPSASQTTSSTT